MQPVILENSPRGLIGSNPKMKTLKADVTPTRMSNYSLGLESSQLNISRNSALSGVQKHQFKLKDLPIYSKTLRFNKKLSKSKMDIFAKTVLGGKYLRNSIKEEKNEDEKYKKKQPPIEDDMISQSSGRNKNIEWTSTPVYK